MDPKMTSTTILNSSSDNSSKADNNDKKDRSDYSIPLCDIRLNESTVRNLMDSSIGVITSNCGYHAAQQSTLDILNDVCCDYIKKIANLLRVSIDTEDWRDEDSDFIDSMERVFHQMNVPSLAIIHQYVCKTRAIQRHKQAVNDRSNQDVPQV